MLDVHNLKKSYHGKLVLDIEHFSFASNGRYALIGANGSGKSTFMRILAGTLAQDSGRVDYKTDQSKLGYLPQNPYRFSLPILKSVMLGQSVKNKELAQQALQLVGLDKDASARGDRLSGGEAQRLALARLFADRRTLLLLDEPSSATDSMGTELVEQSLLTYCEQNACTLIMATHSLTQVKRMVQCAVLLDKGKIVECAPPEQLIAHPQSEPAKRLIGHFKL